MRTSGPGIPASEVFVRRDGELWCEGVALSRIADAVGTPAYVYSANSIDAAYRRLDEALSFGPHLVAYAVKACSNLHVLERLAKAGCGADIVSGGELARCLQAGVPPSRIVYSGVGKRDDEIEAALRAPIRAIHVESAQEIGVVESVARRLGKPAPIALRVNPDVDAETHPYIATGLHDTKFGVELDTARDLLPRILGSEHLALEGVACHIGSQVGAPSAMREAVEIVARFAVELREAGAPLRSLDAGGGFPIHYGDEQAPYPSEKALAEGIRAGLAAGGADQLGLELIVEPGRSLVGASCVLLTRVLYTKTTPHKRFVIADAGMSELIRPSLYQAHHGIEPVVTPQSDVAPLPHDVVGPICETGDFFARGRPLPPLKRGDLFVLHTAGAYGSTMGNNYNSRPFAPEILVEGDAYRVIRRRQPVEDLWALERED